MSIHQNDQQNCDETKEKETVKAQIPSIYV